MLLLSLIYAQSQCLHTDTEVGRETETNSCPHGASEEQVALECRLS